MKGIYVITHQFNARVQSVMAICSILIIVPFLLYYAVVGNLPVAAALLVMLIACCYTTWDIRRRGSQTSTVHLMATVLSAVMITLVYLAGSPASFWLFPMVVANFAILPIRSAVLLNIAAITVTLPVLLQDPTIALRFFPSVLLVNLFLAIFASQLRQRTEQVNQLLLEDTLTGAGNRRALDELLAQCHRAFQSDKLPVALLMMDLDRFKSINDNQGHSARDQVLRRVAEVFRRQLPSGTQLFRFGGEEFTIVAPGAALNDALLLAENVRQALEQYRTTAQPDLAAPITVSTGVAVLRPGESINAWLSRADSALYRAKQEGRNRVCAEEVTSP
jgi:diguanylate cyclase (GGDEF)-like protein